MTKSEIAACLKSIYSDLSKQQKSSLAYLVECISPNVRRVANHSLLMIYQELEKKLRTNALSLLALLIEDVGGSRHLHSLEELLRDEEECINDQPELAFRRMLVTKVASRLDDSQVDDFVTHVSFLIDMDRSNFTDDNGNYDIFCLFSKLEAMEKISYDDTSRLEEWIVKFLQQRQIARSVNGFKAHETITLKKGKAVRDDAMSKQRDDSEKKEEKQGGVRNGIVTQKSEECCEQSIPPAPAVFSGVGGIIQGAGGSGQEGGSGSSGDPSGAEEP